jgi:hypothetical protein
VIHAYRSSAFSAEYSQGSMASYYNGHSFVLGIFIFKQYLSPFFPFRPCIQPLFSLWLLLVDDDKEEAEDIDSFDKSLVQFEEGEGIGSRIKECIEM